MSSAVSTPKTPGGSVDRSKIIGLFTSKLREFSRDIRVILPKDTDTELLLTGLDTLTAMFPEIVLDFMKTYLITPYRSHILARNEDFLKKELVTNQQSQMSTISDLLKKIGNVWDTMKEDQKKILWDYLRIFMAITDKLS
jgi:ferredoxin-fold anticodon binding domain-containing protein